MSDSVRSFLFVCTANQCRSPMAEWLARSLLAERVGVQPLLLETADHRVASAGVRAWPGVPATEDAVTTLAERGIDLSAHRSQELTRTLIEEADVVYCMEEAHRDVAVELAPEAEAKLLLLDPHGRDVEDPVGQGLARYRECCELLERLLKLRLAEPD